ncbi:nucleotide excision repair endonuclease [Priestia aryabhattai]
MTEWQSIINLNVEIPDDELELTISNYKSVKKKCGVYRIYNKDGKLMYVGQTKNLRRRLYEHFTEKRKGYFIQTVRFFYVDFEDEFITKSYLDMYETYLIRKLKPRYNVQQTAPMRYI